MAGRRHLFCAFCDLFHGFHFVLGETSCAARHHFGAVFCVFGQTLHAASLPIRHHLHCDGRVFAAAVGDLRSRIEGGPRRVMAPLEPGGCEFLGLLQKTILRLPKMPGLGPEGWICGKESLGCVEGILCRVADGGFV